MKNHLIKQLLIWVFILTGISAYSQNKNPYYFYKGEKQTLKGSNQIRYFTFNGAKEFSVINSLGSGYSVLSSGRNGGNRALNLIDEEPQNYWALIESKSGVWNSKLTSSATISNFGFSDGSGNLVGISNMFYVKLTKIEDLSLLKVLASENNVGIVGQNKFMSLWFTLACMPNCKRNSLEMANFFYETGEFSASEPDFLPGSLTNCMPDPDFNAQWGHSNIFSCNGWNITMGNPDIIVAIVDHGIDVSHLDLDDNVMPFYYDTPSGTGNFVMYGSHATHVAGICSAESGNLYGVGVAPRCTLLSISDPLDGNNGTTAQTLADGVNFAWQNGADVINCSWFWFSQSNLLDDAITNALSMGRGGLGSIVVFASGNDEDNSTGAPVKYPANSNPDIIVVGASNQNNFRSGFSNYGKQLDVLAPGFQIYSTIPNNNMGYMNGTSMAAPQVSGLAALILSLNPCLTMKEVTEIICESTQKVSTNYTQNKDYGTWNNQYGYGLINVEAALKSVTNTFYQNKTETNVVLHNHLGAIRAGSMVTSPTYGAYIVDAGAKVEFKATSTISLEAGFEVRSEAQFFAQVKQQTEDCGDWNTIYLKTGGAPKNSEALITNELSKGLDGAIANISLYPNPFLDNFTIKFELGQDEMLNVEVFNMIGQLVYANQTLGKKGENKILVDVESNSKMFVVKMQGKKSHFTTVLMKK